MLQWSDIHLYSREKNILRITRGQFLKNRINAILGSSGSGKTSFLKVVGKRLARQRNLFLDCKTIKYRGESITKEWVSFVDQEHNFFSFLTVSEIFDFYARLCGASPTTKEEIFDQMNLKPARDSFCGNVLRKGISGGEKKRLAIGIELLQANRPILMLDEPTSGLDSTQALSIIKTIYSLRLEKLVVLTIHQPGSSIVPFLEYSVFLQKGEICFAGSVPSLLAYIERFGYLCPSQYNPMDFMLDVVTYESVEPMSLNVIPWENTEISRNVFIQKRVSFFKEFYILITSTFLQIGRNSSAFQTRIFTAILLAFLFAALYSTKNPGTNFQMIQNKIGLLYLTTVNQSFSVAFWSINSFITDKHLVWLDLENARYGSHTFFISKFFVEFFSQIIPVILFSFCNYFLVGLRDGWDFFLKYILSLSLASLAAMSLGLTLSACASSPEMAVGLLAPFNVLCLLFAGVFLNLKTLNQVFYHLSNVSYIKWSFGALLRNEFENRHFVCSPEEMNCMKDGNQVLETYGFQNVSFWDCILFVSMICAFFMATAYLCFCCCRRSLF